MNSFLRRALFRKGSPYFAVLPYNLNWMLPERLWEQNWDGTNPIVLLDVGCRGGIPQELWTLRKRIHYIGFEADVEECERLQSEPPDCFKRDLFAFFVGATTGRQEFHVYGSPGASSSLLPDENYANNFADPLFVVRKTLSVETVSLDSFYKENPAVPAPDFLKLDTQGTELRILQGATRCLQECSLVELEVEFIRMYQKQALFHELMEFMHEEGFDLLYLNRVFQQRKKFAGFAKGQVTFGDALFVRRPELLGLSAPGKVANLVRMLLNLGHLDLANDIIDKNFCEDSERQELKQMIEAQKGRFRVRQFRKFASPFLDKLILVLLHMRGCNGLRFDSDRAWPFR